MAEELEGLDGLDGCECVWSHEVAMRRLLYWIRQTQASCTDTECTVALSVLPTPNNVGERFSILTVLAIMVVMLYIIRPSLFSANENPIQKANTDKTDTDNDKEDPNNGRAPPAVN